MCLSQKSRDHVHLKNPGSFENNYDSERLLFQNSYSKFITATNMTIYHSIRKGKHYFDTLILDDQ